MVYTIRDIVGNILEFTTVMLLFMAVFLPIAIHLRKVIKEKTLEADDHATKVFFGLLLLDVISLMLSIIAKNPDRLLEAVVTGLGLSLALLFFFCITLFVVRIIQGKGAVRRFLGINNKKK